MSDQKEKIKDEEEYPLKDEKAKQQNKGFKEKLKYVTSNITVEPILAGLVISAMLSRLAIQNLNLDKACRVKKNFGDEICDSLIERSGNTSYEAEVQAVISNIESWKSILQTAISTIIVIFMGAWSDRTGNRKLCILLPIFGEFMLCFSNILSTYFFYDVSVEVTMFLEAVVPAVTGDWVLVYLGVFSYISDVTDKQSRTFRLGLVNLCLTAGIPIGTALSGILLKLWGYYGVFAISASIYLLTISYGLCYLKSNTKRNACEKEKPKPVTCCEIATLVKETGEVAFKRRESKLRKKIVLTLLVVAIIYGPNNGEKIITYMYVRYKLKWDALKYSIYSTYSVCTHSLGALLSIYVFSKRWGFHDSTLCLISVMSKLVGSLFMTFVHTDFQMFMVPLVEILNATTFTSLRSLASKLVLSDELGKMNSLFSLVETLAALVHNPTYSKLYAATLSVFTGAVFIYSAFMTLPAIAILIWFLIQNRKEVKAKNIEKRLATPDFVMRLKKTEKTEKF